MATELRAAALLLTLAALASAGCSVTVVSRLGPPPPAVEARSEDAAGVHDLGRRTPARPEVMRWNDADFRPGAPAPGRTIRPERTRATPNAARAGSAARRGAERPTARSRAREGATAD